MSAKKTFASADVAAKVETEKITNLKATDTGGFCMYLGPTIIGVVQNGTIYQGSKKTVLKELADAIETYPLIASLVISDKTLSEDRVKIKTPGNALYANYRKLASGNK